MQSPRLLASTPFLSFSLYHITKGALKSICLFLFQETVPIKVSIAEYCVRLIIARGGGKWVDIRKTWIKERERMWCKAGVRFATSHLQILIKQLRLIDENSSVCEEKEDIRSKLAQSLKKELEKISKKHCIGSQNDHGSQKQHLEECLLPWKIKLKKISKF